MMIVDTSQDGRRRRIFEHLAVLGLLVTAAPGCASEISALSEDLDRSSEPGANPGLSIAGVDLSEDQAPAVENQAFVGSSTVYGPDYFAAGIGGLRNTGGGSFEVVGVSGFVKKALLFWHGPTATTDTTINAQAQLNGWSIRGNQIGFSYSNNWPGYTNSQAYMADVTGYVRGNGTYRLTGLRRDSSATTNGASLLVFYDDGDASNDRNVTVVKGNDSVCQSAFDGPGFRTVVSGLWYEAGAASVQLHVADGQAYSDAALFANGLMLAPTGSIFDGDSVPWAQDGAYAKNSLWDVKRFGIGSSLTTGTNTVVVSTGAYSDCIALVAAAVDLPAKCPWGGVYDPTGFGGTGSCRYSFDAIGRNRSARYAMSWATSVCPLFCAYQFKPYVPVGSPAVDYTCQAPSDATDCANFVSQALFYGGVPMAKGWYCDDTIIPELCVRGNHYELRPAGWAGAARSFSGGGLPKYYGYNIAESYDTYQIIQDPSVEQGLPASWTAADTEELRDTLPSDQPHKVTRTGILLDKLGITQGDIMSTNGHDWQTAHVLLVVGWGPRKTSWDALRRVDMATLTPRRTKTNTVPYVIDHGLHQMYALEHGGEANASAIGGPIPYYATRWNPDGSIFNDARHFIKVPEEIVIPYDEAVIPSGTATLRQRMESACPVL